MLQTEYDFDRSKLDKAFDVGKLQDEAEVAARLFPAFIHYSVIPLTMAGERNESITDFSDPDWTTWVDTPLLQQSPYIQEVLNTLQCKKTNVRLMRIEPGGFLQEHTDPQLDLERHNQVRLHVPIFTNDDVDFILNGKRVPLQPGELWYMRLSDPHSVNNNSDQERIQLSIDVVVNDWVESLILSGDKA